MESIQFIELSDVMEIHVDQILLYGGTTELRDTGLLESAIEQARATFSGEYLHAFPFEMAAAYLFHVVNNHPFVDGNKRTGTVAALVFLDWNGYQLDCQIGELAELTLAVATGQRSKLEIAEFFRSNCVLKRP